MRSRDSFLSRELLGIVMAAIVAAAVGAGNWQEDGFGVRDGSRVDLGSAAINAAVAALIILAAFRLFVWPSLRKHS